MRKLKSILVGTWLSVGCLPMWAMDQLPLVPQEAEKREGTVRVAFKNEPEYCSIFMFYQQGPDNFWSRFLVPFHPNIETDKPFFEKNLQSIVNILQKDGEPITKERWDTLIQVLEGGLQEGHVQQDRVASAVSEIPEDKVKTIVDLYNDAFDQITTFVVKGIERISVRSNEHYFTTDCSFRNLPYTFTLPLIPKGDVASRVARAMSRFVADLVQQQDGSTPSTIDPITQKICNKMARPSFWAKSPERQTRILSRAIRMILMDRGYPVEELFRLSSDIVDHWNQLKGRLDGDVTWTQDSDYHVANAEQGQEIVTIEDNIHTPLDERTKFLGNGTSEHLGGLLTKPFGSNNTPVRSTTKGLHHEYVTTPISGGASTDAYSLDRAREELTKKIGEMKILLKKAEQSEDHYSFPSVLGHIVFLKKQLDQLGDPHVQVPSPFHKKVGETYKSTTASSTSTDTSTPIQNPRHPSIAVRYGLTLEYRF